MQNFIPYTHAEEDFEYTINPEAEVAIAFLQSIQDGDERLEEIIKIHYPFMVYTSEENQQVFDLLGLSNTEKHLLAPNDISDLLSKLLEGESDRLGLLDFDVSFSLKRSLCGSSRGGVRDVNLGTYCG